MSPGAYVSVSGHVIFLGWLVLGWGLSSDPLPFDIAEVDVVSSEEFANLTSREAPNVPSELPPSLVAPEFPLDEAPQEAPVVEAPPEPSVPTAATPPPAADPAPAPEQPVPAPPTPEPEPAPEPAPPTPPPPPVNTAVGTSTRPRPRPSDVISSDNVAPPEPDVEIADQTQEAVVEAETSETPAEEQEATAEEEQSSAIVTEADEPEDAPVIQDEEVALAPTTSLRPQLRRPQPPAAQEVSETEPSEEEPADAPTDSITSTLEQILDSEETPTPSGAPLTSGELEGFRVAISDCWALPIGTDAQRTTVAVTFDLSQSGQVSNIEMARSDGPSDAATRAAFEAARVAILRCEKGGYDLPVEKYDQWSRVQITFDPNQMRLR